MIDGRCGSNMNLRTFTAPTFAQAMILVKTEMGKEAVILHTRTVRGRRWMGLRRRETVEITAGIGLNVTARPGRKPSAAAPAAPQRPSRDPIPQRQPSASPGRDLLETP